MKNITLIILLVLINSCIAQQKKIKSLNDDNLTENIINQFSSKANVKIENSIFVLYFQEKPSIKEVENEKEREYIHDGIIVTIYRFESINQISEFSKDFDIYKKSNKIFYIFDKNSNDKVLGYLKVNKLSQFDMVIADKDYDPKSWVITFNSSGYLEKCSPYNCN